MTITFRNIKPITFNNIPTSKASLVHRTATDATYICNWHMSAQLVLESQSVALGELDDSPLHDRLVAGFKAVYPAASVVVVLDADELINILVSFKL